MLIPKNASLQSLLISENLIRTGIRTGAESYEHSIRIYKIFWYCAFWHRYTYRLYYCKARFILGIAIFSVIFDILDGLL